MSHNDMYVRAVMADRMREARVARRASGVARAARRSRPIGHNVVALIARMVLR
jgi:hypothetical protein